MTVFFFLLSILRKIRTGTGELTVCSPKPLLRGKNSFLEPLDAVKHDHIVEYKFCVTMQKQTPLNRKKYVFSDALDVAQHDLIVVYKLSVTMSQKLRKHISNT